MKRADFRAWEHNSSGGFDRAEFAFTEDSGGQWIVSRNGTQNLVLGHGHRLLKTLCCGICSTDLARRFLPFPLPQIIGHEAVAEDPDTGERFVIEINDTCNARGDKDPEVFCRFGLHAHCPERLVLGIDRLPGGFGSWILAPVNALVPIGTLDSRIASLAEPLAAAIHAVAVSRPQSGDRVAVLGTGRLGLLIIAALASFRETKNINFSIEAVARTAKNRELALSLGADASEGSVQGKYDLVFECTGDPDGLQAGLGLARRELHIKSTHGRPFLGIMHMTELVVDEISILPNSKDSLDSALKNSQGNKISIFVSEGNISGYESAGFDAFGGSISAALDHLESYDKEMLPRFDLCSIKNLNMIDSMIRPRQGSGTSLVRPGGAILLDSMAPHPVADFIHAGGRIRTSRCGSLRDAVGLIQKNHDLVRRLKSMITHEYPASNLPEAFIKATDSASVKVLVRHDE
jgi:threonine dehydrogenase-like Zn-dependent dehydrogenase